MRHSSCGNDESCGKPSASLWMRTQHASRCVHLFVRQLSLCAQGAKGLTCSNTVVHNETQARALFGVDKHGRIVYANLVIGLQFVDPKLTLHQVTQAHSRPTQPLPLPLTKPPQIFSMASCLLEDNCIDFDKFVDHFQVCRHTTLPRHS